MAKFATFTGVPRGFPGGVSAGGRPAARSEEPSSAQLATAWGGENLVRNEWKLLKVGSGGPCRTSGFSYNYIYTITYVYIYIYMDIPCWLIISCITMDNNGAIIDQPTSGFSGHGFHTSSFLDWSCECGREMLGDFPRPGTINGWMQLLVDEPPNGLVRWWAHRTV